MIALAVIGAIVLLVLMLLLLPVGVRVQYDSSFHLWLKYGPFLIKLINTNDKPKKEKSKKDKVKSKHNRDKGKKSLPSFSEIISAVEKAVIELSSFFKKLWFKRFNISVVVSDDDAASAAINYGRACAVATTLYTALEKRLNPYDTNISVDLNYDSKTTAELDIILNTLTINVIVLAIKILLIILPFILSDKKKGGKNNEHR